MVSSCNITINHIQNTRCVRNGDIYRKQVFFKREHHKLTAVSFSLGQNDFMFLEGSFLRSSRFGLCLKKLTAGKLIGLGDNK